MAERAQVRVFLAEDHDDIAVLVRRRLESRAWSVTRASTAEEAARRLRGDRYDAVILDYKLPDGNGLDLLQIVREASPATPVLFLTAHGSEQVALRALGEGASDYMVKSGTMLDELPTRIEGLLARGDDLRHAAGVVAARGAAPKAAEGVAPARGEEILRGFVAGDVLGAALFDGAGAPIATLLPASLDPRALGLALVQVHAQAVLLARTTRLSPRAYQFVLEAEEGVLAATAVRDRAIVAVLVASSSSRAPERLETLASRLRERL